MTEPPFAGEREATPPPDLPEKETAMLKLMQGASALTLAAVLALGPVAAVAQTATDGGTGTGAQTGTDAPATDETAQDSTILPQDGDDSESDTAQTEPVEPAEGTATGTESETAQTESVAPVEGADTGADTDTAQTEPLPPATGAEPAVPGTGGTQAAEIEGDGMVEPVEGTIQMQSQNTILASDLMGARLYNANEETVGSVDDVIVSTDGTVEGVVIGVGGFLGIGQKMVAVEMNQISVQADALGNPRLLLDSTREALEAAPEFVTVADQANAPGVQGVEPTQGLSGAAGGTGAAPAAD
jgi:sporulation protein YlmC with PRC-barrel domain